MTDIFLSFNPARLSNASHLNFHSRILDVAPRSIGSLKRLPKRYDAFLAAHENEEKSGIRSRRERLPNTDEVRLLAKDCRALFAHVCQSLQAIQLIPMPEEAAAAHRLWFVVEPLYKQKIRRYDTMRITIKTMLNRVLIDSFQADIDTLSLGKILHTLHNKLEQFNTLYSAHISSRIKRIHTKSIKVARLESDQALKDYLEALKILKQAEELEDVRYLTPQDSQALATAIHKINATITSLKHEMAHHKGKLTLARKRKVSPI